MLFEQSESSMDTRTTFARREIVDREERRLADNVLVDPLQRDWKFASSLFEFSRIDLGRALIVSRYPTQRTRMF